MNSHLCAVNFSSSSNNIISELKGDSPLIDTTSNVSEIVLRYSFSTLVFPLVYSVYI